MGKQAWAVIGASFGDEGKGLATDYLCSKTGPGTTVIRFNGGAQAGHTVETRNQRHVFHHFGSGSFFGANTHLSERFICNPILFHQERKELVIKGVSIIRVSADANCRVTTPWDMMINRILEDKRGPGARHGSCGLGINETVTRNADTTFGLTLGRVNKDDDSIREILRRIQHEYVPYRLEQLGIARGELTVEQQKHLSSDDILNQYRKDLLKFLVYVKLLPLEKLKEQHIVFEGAQGLGLDQDRGTFPHVTRSSTGLQNVMDLCPTLGIEELKVVYATRPYITRHGEGPLPYELADKPWPSIVDATNIPNQWQGMLRYGLMDEAGITDRITLDLSDARYKIQDLVDIRPTVMLSCVDQIPGGLENGRFRVGPNETKTVPEFLSALRQKIGSRKADVCFVSNGPSRDYVMPLIHNQELVAHE